MNSTDLAVGAPGNRTVYIYYGSSNGLITEYAQNITAPGANEKNEVNQMFGYGLSKGADIDGNGYLDIAIGSPETDTVYVYKSYPVIRTACSIVPSEERINRKNSTFEFQVVCKFNSNSDIKIGSNVTIHASIELDARFKRAHFNENNGQNKIDFDGALPLDKMFTANYSFFAEHVFDPITIGLSYEVSNNLKNQQFVQSKKFEYIFIISLKIDKYPENPPRFLQKLCCSR